MTPRPWEDETIHALIFFQLLCTNSRSVKERPFPLQPNRSMLDFISLPPNKKVVHAEQPLLEDLQCSLLCMVFPIPMCAVCVCFPFGRCCMINRLVSLPPPPKITFDWPCSIDQVCELWNGYPRVSARPHSKKKIPANVSLLFRSSTYSFHKDRKHWTNYKRTAHLSGFLTRQIDELAGRRIHLTWGRWKTKRNPYSRVSTCWIENPSFIWRKTHHQAGPKKKRAGGEGHIFILISSSKDHQKSFFLFLDPKNSPIYTSNTWNTSDKPKACFKKP